MSTPQGGHRLDEIARRWRDLADRRLGYFTELYRSGRWKRYYSEESFAARMRDVIKAVKLWRDLADRSLANQILLEESFSRPQPARNDRMRPAA